MQKLTPWFEPGTKPARIGVYQRDHCGYTEYSYWDGQQWRFGRRTALAADQINYVSRFQDLPWRGVMQ
jgi:hypothetical protein